MLYKKASICFSALLLVLILIVPFGIFGVYADSDFTIENGVLISYKGTSQKVSIPEEVYCIGDYAFENNTTVKTIELNNVTVIGEGAFRNCTALTTFKEYDGIASCGAYAFSDTPFFEQNTEQDIVMGSVLVHSKAEGMYTIPSHIKSLAPYAFAQNSKLVSVSAGENVVSIGEGTFWKCSALESVSLSNTVSHIGPYAFEGTKFLSSNQDEFLIMGNGILVDVNTAQENVTIPSGVKQIGGGAFLENENLKFVTIPEGVSGIGKRAFADCTSLENALIPESVVSVGEEAFYNCTSLEDVVIPETVKILEDSAYLGCTSLKTARVYTDAPLSTGLFAGCANLESVLVSTECKNVMSYAFYGCESLKEIAFPPTVSYIAENAFDACGNLTVYCYTDGYAGTILKDYGVNVSSIGDVNGDGKLNIRDATQIRKFIAGLITLEFSDVIKSDADFNGVINVRDATWIQKKLAGVD